MVGLEMTLCVSAAPCSTLGGREGGWEDGGVRRRREGEEREEEGGCEEREEEGRGHRRGEG